MHTDLLWSWLTQEEPYRVSILGVCSTGHIYYRIETLSCSSLLASESPPHLSSLPLPAQQAGPSEPPSRHELCWDLQLEVWPCGRAADHLLTTFSYLWHLRTLGRLVNSLLIVHPVLVPASPYVYSLFFLIGHFLDMWSACAEGP